MSFMFKDEESGLTLCLCTIGEPLVRPFVYVIDIVATWCVVLGIFLNFIGLPIYRKIYQLTSNNESIRQINRLKNLLKSEEEAIKISSTESKVVHNKETEVSNRREISAQDVASSNNISIVSNKTEISEQTLVAGRTENLEYSPVSGRIENLEQTLFSDEIEYLEQTLVADRIEDSEHTPIASGIEYLEQILLADRIEDSEHTPIASGIEDLKHKLVSGGIEDSEQTLVADRIEDLEHTLVASKIEVLEHTLTAGGIEDLVHTSIDDRTEILKHGFQTFCNDSSAFNVILVENNITGQEVLTSKVVKPVTRRVSLIEEVTILNGTGTFEESANISHVSKKRDNQVVCLEENSVLNNLADAKVESVVCDQVNIETDRKDLSLFVVSAEEVLNSSLTDNLVCFENDQSEEDFLVNFARKLVADVVQESQCILLNELSSLCIETEVPVPNSSFTDNVVCLENNEFEDDNFVRNLVEEILQESQRILLNEMKQFVDESLVVAVQNSGNELEHALSSIGRSDVVKSCMKNIEIVTELNERIRAQEIIGSQDELVIPKNESVEESDSSRYNSTFEVFRPTSSENVFEEEIRLSSDDRRSNVNERTSLEDKTIKRRKEEGLRELLDALDTTDREDILTTDNHDDAIDFGIANEHLLIASRKPETQLNASVMVSLHESQAKNLKPFQQAIQSDDDDDDDVDDDDDYDDGREDHFKRLSVVMEVQEVVQSDSESQSETESATPQYKIRNLYCESSSTSMEPDHETSFLVEGCLDKMSDSVMNCYSSLHYNEEPTKAINHEIDQTTFGVSQKRPAAPVTSQYEDLFQRLDKANLCYSGAPEMELSDEGD